MGNIISLSLLKGKVVLVDFWASWCRACRIENPKFAHLYEEYQAKGFEIISISKDENESKWQKAIEKDRVAAWIHIWDPALFIRIVMDCITDDSFWKNIPISTAKNWGVAFMVQYFFIRRWAF